MALPGGRGRTINRGGVAKRGWARMAHGACRLWVLLASALIAAAADHVALLAVGQLGEIGAGNGVEIETELA